jgi:uncharacterized peroxidase-related enzyme
MSDTTAQGKSKELIDTIKSKMGGCPNIFRTMAHSPAALEGLLGFSQALSGTTLSAADRERIALLAAQLNNCGYCLSAHSMLGGMAGLSPEAIGAARKGDASDPKTKAILTIAAELITKRGRVPNDQLESARAAGVSDAQLVEIVAVVALNLFTNYFNHFASTEIDFPKVEL